MGSKSANSKSKSKSNGKQKNGKVKLRKKDNIWVRIVKAFVGDKVSEQMEKHEPDHPTLCYNAEKQRWEKVCSYHFSFFKFDNNMLSDFLSVQSPIGYPLKTGSY